MRLNNTHTFEHCAFFSGSKAPLPKSEGDLTPMSRVSDIEQLYLSRISISYKLCQDLDYEDRSPSNYECYSNEDKKFSQFASWL